MVVNVEWGRLTLASDATLHGVKQAWRDLSETLVDLDVFANLDPAEAAHQASLVADGANPLTLGAFADVIFAVNGDDVADMGVEEFLKVLTPALAQHGLALRVESVAEEESAPYAYDVIINERRCQILAEGEWLHAGLPATARPLAVVNGLLEEAGARARVFATSLGEVDAVAYLLNPKVIEAMDAARLFTREELPELIGPDSDRPRLVRDRPGVANVVAVFYWLALARLLRRGFGSPAWVERSLGTSRAGKPWPRLAVPFAIVTAFIGPFVAPLVIGLGGFALAGRLINHSLPAVAGVLIAIGGLMAGLPVALLAVTGVWCLLPDRRTGGFYRHPQRLWPPSLATWLFTLLTANIVWITMMTAP